MPFSPIPKLCFVDVFALTPAILAQHGITLLLLDLDNTLSSYSEHMPTEQVLSWMKSLQDAGVSLYIISNNRSKSRIDNYAAACGIASVHRAGKPHPRALHKAMQEMGKTAEETALMGDQIFTDALAANRAGALSIVVTPIEMKNLFFKLRYHIEQPFRRKGMR